MKKFILPLLFALLLPLCAQAADLPSLNMASLQNMLEKNRGKVVMLNFFATWCPPCQKEIPEIVKLREAFTGEQLLIIGLSVDDNKSLVPPFLSKFGANYPVYMAARDVTDKFNVSSVPHNAFIAPDGRIVISEPGMAEEAVLMQVVKDLLKDN